MRNLHAFIKQEFGEESVLKLHLWEKNRKEDGQLSKSQKIHDQMLEK